MTSSLLYLNDVHVQLIDEGRPIVGESSQLVFDGDTLKSGDAALARVRISPLAAVNLHWQQLSQQPVKLPHTGYRHYADLAFWQITRWLDARDSKAPVVVAPSYRYQPEQYSLLAGMIQAAGAAPAGFIHAALLHSYGALASHPFDTPLVHVDVCLHQAHMTELRIQDNQLIIHQEWDFPELGLHNIIQQWLQKVAKLCIAQTRYDPLHSAESEQRLFNQWPSCLEQLKTNSVANLDIDGHEVEIAVDEVTQLYSELLTQLGRATGTPLLSPTAQLLPAVRGQALNTNQLAEAMTQLPQNLLASGGIKLLRSLPLPEDLARQASAIPKASKIAATHLLLGHTAYPIDARLAISPDGNLHPNIGTRATALDTLAFERDATHWYCRPNTAISINGAEVTQRQPLAAGDRITCEDQEFLCIYIEGSNHGA